jgi:hypothetical protein
MLWPFSTSAMIDAIIFGRLEPFPARPTRQKCRTIRVNILQAIEFASFNLK